MSPAPTAPYDALYLTSDGCLWRDSPGRVVAEAAARLRPGRALDLGSGDGRNSLWLESVGWTVDAYDSSAVATALAHERYRRAGCTPKGTVDCRDVSSLRPRRQGYDLVLAYGLCHCLDDDQLRMVLQVVMAALKPGGLLAFSALEASLPIPEGHGTVGLHLRSAETWQSLVSAFRVLSWDLGYIDESHDPVIGPHRHAAVWALCQA